MSEIKHILEYKGFIGSIEADANENMLYGFVQNLPEGKTDAISYEGETIKELREDFQQSIDFFLEENSVEELKEN